MEIHQLLLETLDDLLKKDLKRFQWWLQNDVLDGCKAIPLSRLEDANQTDTVSVMIQHYGEEMAVKLTIEILKKMGKNNAAENLKKRYAGGKTAAASTSAAAPPAPAAPPAAAPAAPPAAAPAAPPAAAPAAMMAQQGSVIIAPTVTGGTSGTWNITINK